MMVLSREAERTISGASEVVAMAVTNDVFVCVYVFNSSIRIP